jgi:hypothetical protein
MCLLAYNLRDKVLKERPKRCFLSFLTLLPFIFLLRVSTWPPSAPEAKGCGLKRYQVSSRDNTHRRIGCCAQPHLPAEYRTALVCSFDWLTFMQLGAGVQLPGKLKAGPLIPRPRSG